MSDETIAIIEITTDTSRVGMRKLLKQAVKAGAGELWLAVGGFDTDPRELWQVPEARKAVLTFADTVTVAGLIDKLGDGARFLVAACAEAEGLAPGWEMTVVGDNYFVTPKRRPSWMAAH